MSAISGFGGRVRVGGAGGISLPAGRWTVNVRPDTVDVSTFEHDIAHEYVIAGRDYEISVDCFWDQNINAINAPPNLLAGGLNSTHLSTDNIQIDLFLDRLNANNSWNFSKVYVENMTMDSEVRGVVRYSITGRATSAVTFGGASPTLSGTIGFPTNT